MGRRVEGECVTSEEHSWGVKYAAVETRNSSNQASEACFDKLHEFRGRLGEAALPVSPANYFNGNSNVKVAPFPGPSL